MIDKEKLRGAITKLQIVSKDLTNTPGGKSDFEYFRISEQIKAIDIILNLAQAYLSGRIPKVGREELVNTLCHSDCLETVYNKDNKKVYGVNVEKLADAILGIAGGEEVLKEIPETFMGYKIEELKQVIYFAKRNGYDMEKLEPLPKGKEIEKLDIGFHNLSVVDKIFANKIDELIKDRNTREK